MVFSLRTSTCILAKSRVVPGHIGSLHVHNIDINPEIDKRRDCGHERWTEHCVQLPMLIIGTHQNNCWLTYLSGEMPKCLLSSPHSSVEYCLFWEGLIFPMLWREQRAHASSFPPNIIICSALISTAMYWCMKKKRENMGESLNLDHTWGHPFVLKACMNC